MKKTIILIAILLATVGLHELAYADNLLYFEILESDTSFKEVGGGVSLTNGFKLKGNYNFSRINQYNIGLDISKINISITRDIFDKESLNLGLGIAYNYESAHLSSTYFPQMGVSTKESGLTFRGDAEVKIDDKFSAFGEIGYTPKARFRSQIEGDEGQNISHDNSKYSAKIGTKIRIADNLSGRVGYSFTRYKDQINSSLSQDSELQENLNNNQSGIFFGLETNF